MSDDHSKLSRRNALKCMRCNSKSKPRKNSVTPNTICGAGHATIHSRPERRRRLADSLQLAAVSLTTRDPGRYSRPTVLTLTDEAAWRLRHDVSPVPG